MEHDVKRKTPSKPRYGTAVDMWRRPTDTRLPGYPGIPVVYRSRGSIYIAFGYYIWGAVLWVIPGTWCIRRIPVKGLYPPGMSILAGYPNTSKYIPVPYQTRLLKFAIKISMDRMKRPEYQIPDAVRA